MKCIRHSWDSREINVSCKRAWVGSMRCMCGQLRGHQIPEQSTEGCKANDHPFFCVGEYTVWCFFVDKAGERLCLVMVFLCQDLDLRAEVIASWLQGLGIINVSNMVANKTRLLTPWQESSLQASTSCKGEECGVVKIWDMSHWWLILKLFLIIGSSWGW